MRARLDLLRQWLGQLGYQHYQLEAASEDASFRRYWRLQLGEKSWIVMDAPPETEPCEAFIAIAKKLRDANLNAPEIVSANLASGFVLLTDFGDSDFLSVLGAETEASLYDDALAALLQMQIRIDPLGLPEYDKKLLHQELELFRHWFLEQFLDVELNDSQQRSWDEIKQVLVINALEQPQVFVHRDYHSRNLMWVESNNPGILDFQDAVRGPVTYDLVSILRDCYIDWPPSRVDQLAQNYYALLRANRRIDVSLATFMRWFNLMGIQRHLKAIGIFSRLKIRDGKRAYLKDIPRTLNYVCQESSKAMSMAPLHTMIEQLGLRSRVRSLADG